MNRRRLIEIGSLCAALGALSACKEKPAASSAEPAAEGSAPAKVLRFSAIPNQNATELQQKFQPLGEYLSKELGVPVEFVPAADYKASVELFKNGQIQLAWFGGVTGVQARHAVPGAQAIAQGAEDTEFHSLFIAHQDTGLEKSPDFPMAIAPLRFTFGADSSTSGRVMPEYYIRQATGKPSSEFFALPVNFSGSHDKTCELVESGQFQAGVVDFTVYRKRVESGQTDPEVVRVIWQTPTYQDYNFTAHPSLEEDFGSGFTGRLQEALTQMDEKAPQLLEAFPRRELIPATNEQYARLEEVCRELGFLR